MQHVSNLQASLVNTGPRSDVRAVGEEVIASFGVVISKASSPRAINQPRGVIHSFIGWLVGGRDGVQQELERSHGNEIEKLIEFERVELVPTAALL